MIIRRADAEISGYYVTAGIKPSLDSALNIILTMQGYPNANPPKRGL